MEKVTEEHTFIIKPYTPVPLMVISSRKGTVTAMINPYTGPNKRDVKTIKESFTSRVKNPTGILIKYIHAYANAQNMAVAQIFLILMIESFLFRIIKKSPFP